MRLRLIAATVGILSASTPALATTIDFTAVTMGAANTLLIDGITVTGDGGALVSTAAGQGLGLVGVGLNASIDRVLHWEQGAFPNGGSGASDGTLSFAVDGTITAFTFMPFVTIVEGPQPTTLPGFEMSYVAPVAGLTADRSYLGLLPTTRFDPVTVTFRPDRLPFALTGIGLISDSGQANYFSQYMHDAGFPSATIQFGFSILSMDYTPTQAAPEPATLALLIPAALLLRRRRGHG
jgi:hypothetical protein